ncbi:hypothetical protein ACJMQP_00055 [Rhodopseudomonas palustris]
MIQIHNRSFEVRCRFGRLFLPDHCGATAATKVSSDVARSTVAPAHFVTNVTEVLRPPGYSERPVDSSIAEAAAAVGIATVIGQQDRPRLFLD